VVLPRQPGTYAYLCIAYSFAAGLTYGTWSAFVLEAVGGGAAATKYTIYASLANVPIWYMTLLDGEAAGRWGALKMLVFDAAAGVAGLVVLAALVVLLKRVWPAKGAAVNPAESA
jgi:hypothetical protein